MNKKAQFKQKKKKIGNKNCGKFLLLNSVEKRKITQKKKKIKMSQILPRFGIQTDC